MKANIISTSQIEIVPEDERDTLLLSFFSEKVTEKGLRFHLGKFDKDNKELTGSLVFSVDWPEKAGD